MTVATIRSGPSTGTEPVNALLDTATLLFLDGGGRRLSGTARAAIESEATQLFMSVVSTWEFYVKTTVKKLQLPEPIPAFVARLRDAYGIALIDMVETDLMPLERLPMHHRDPFDRVLIAQSIARGFTVVSPDVMLRRYEDAHILW